MSERVQQDSTRVNAGAGRSRRWALVLVTLLPLLGARETLPTLAAAPAEDPPNVLLILIDDLGIEHLEFYGIGTETFPPAPNLADFAAGGLLFLHAWSSPLCSPTRAMVQTGRYGFRTGIGTNTFPEPFTMLPAEELILPELLRLHAPSAYVSGMFGKWHLGSTPEAGGELAPNVAGFDHYAGTLALEFGEDAYFNFPRTVNGTTTQVTDTYLTTDQVDSAIEWIQSVSAPWLAVVAPFAVHKPFHWPPEALHTQDTSAEGDVPRYRAMIEALDNELGRLLAAVDLAETLVIIASDNGSPPEVAMPPVASRRAKSTLYQGGIRVPLLVAGPGVTPGQVDGLVNLSDLFATIAEVAGAVPPAETVLDSVSLVPYFAQPGLASLRTHAFAETFYPNGAGPYDQRTVAARNDRFKYGQRSDSKEAMFDLWNDPWEDTNVLKGNLTPEEEVAYDDITLYLAELAGACTLAQKGETCETDADCCSGRCRGRQKVCK